MSKNNYDLDPFCANLIHRKARQLVGQAGFGRSDFHDIEQELACRLLERKVHFDPSVAHWRVFATMVIERQVASILKHRRAQCRDCRRNGASLDAQYADSDGEQIALSAAMTNSAHDFRLAIERSGDEAHVELSCDLADWLKKLSPLEQAICHHLKYHSVAETSRHLNIPPSTLGDAIDRLSRRPDCDALKKYC